MVARPVESFNHIVNAGMAHISDAARAQLIQKTEMDSDGAFTSAYHNTNAAPRHTKGRDDDMRQQVAFQLAIDADSGAAEFLYDVADFVLTRLETARNDLEQAEAQDAEMQAALESDTGESLSSYDFKEQLEAAPEGDFELTQPQMDMLQTALDKPNLQASDEQLAAMQRALDAGVISEADLDMVTGGVDAYSQLEAMEAFGTVEAAVDTDYSVSRAQQNVTSLEQYYEYIERDDIQQQLAEGELTQEDILAQMPQNVRNAYEAEHGPIEPSTPADEMVVSDGARATAGADTYVEPDAELAAQKAGAPLMNSHFGAAHAGISPAPTPANAPNAPSLANQGPTPEETAAYRDNLKDFNL